jgi:imidazole glycerol-phosphate synthase subunit HisH
MIAIINYGAGNLHSVNKAIEFVGGRAVVSDDPEIILNTEKVILPGVGAFKDGMDGLEKRGLTKVVKQVAQSGVPFLGICLGMQLFFEESEEQGLHRGLELLPGRVLEFTDPGIKVPQIGWNQLQIADAEFPLLKDIPTGAHVYFNHSFFCQPTESEHVMASTDYASSFASVVSKGNIHGVQFHPEKSQKVGLQILKNFVEMENE